MNKVLDKIFELLPLIDSDWKTHLDRLGIWDNVFDLYTEAKDGPEANRLLAFIVLAYHYRSEMIEISKDRLEVKRKIMIRVAGLGFKDSKVLSDAAVGLNSVTNRVAAWFVDEQKDWRWGDIISKIELHSRTNASVSHELEPDSDSAKRLEMATKLRKDADLMWNEIRREFLPLDNALVAEGKPKITENLSSKDFTSWEAYVRKIQQEKKRQQQEAEDDAELLKEAKRKQKEDDKIQRDAAKAESPF
jgi:hypothetical protein